MVYHKNVCKMYGGAVREMAQQVRELAVHADGLEFKSPAST